MILRTKRMKKRNKKGWEGERGGEKDLLAGRMESRGLPWCVGLCEGMGLVIGYRDRIQE